MKRCLALVLVAACGDGSGEIDPPPVNPGSVSVEVRLSGVPQANIEVIFQEADSTVKSVTFTDVAGIATGDIGAGGFVTVVEPRQGTARDTLSTFTNVQPDDALHLDLVPPVEQGEPVTFRLQITPDADPLATSHVVQTTCGQAETFGIAEPQDVTLLGCGTSADLLVVSGDDTGTVLNAKLVRDVRLDAAEVVLDGNDYTAFLTPAVSYQDVPANVPFIGTYRAYDTERGRLFEASTGVEIVAGLGKADVVSPDLVTRPTDVQLTSSALYPTREAIGQQLIVEWSEMAIGRDYTLNVGDALLPGYSERPVYDLAARVASWSESGGGQEPNLVRAELQIYRDDIPEGRAWTWRIVGGRAGTAIEFPELPFARDGFDFNANDGDTVSVHTLTTAKLPVGYDDLATRARGFDDLKQQITGTNGQLITQDLTDFVDDPEPEL